jgi:RimJ/RimL family protein N-acetyltransferase
MQAVEPIYTIQRFTPANVEAYKAIRLEALQTEPGMYGNSYAMEAAFTDEQWMDRIMKPGQARFGLYAGDELIGLTGIIIEDEEKGDAYMTQSYIRQEHRGQKLSRLLYEARMAWARANGIRRLIISHKATNYASKAANQRFGFCYTHSESRTWPDGSTEDNLFYELILK